MKNLTIKLITAVTAAALITCGLAACSAGNTEPSEKTKQDKPTDESIEETTESWIEEPPTTVQEVTLGGWEIPEDMTVTADMQSLFAEAFADNTDLVTSNSADLSADQLRYYYPVLLLGTQVVAGTNYAFLCYDGSITNSADRDYVIAYIYVDLNGKASFLGEGSLGLPGAGGENVVGGWECAVDCTVTSEIEDIMAKATETLTGATYEPVAYIGSQLVAGMNHAILCKSSPSVEELGGASSYVLVYVYEDLDGNCEITDTVDIVLEV